MLYIVSVITPFLHLGLIIIVAIVEAISRELAKVNLRLESQFRPPITHVTDESNDLGYESSHRKSPVNTAR